MDRLIRVIHTKRMLYLLCFMILNYIEFKRATGTGNVWAAAANCTGLVMMVIVFSVLPVKEFLRPRYYVYTAICAAILPVIYLFWRGHKGEFYLGQAETAVLNVWWLGLAGSFLWKRIFEEKKVKMPFGLKSGLWIMFTMWTVISVAGKWWPVWFLLLFGIFYLLKFSGEELSSLIDGMINGTIYSFFILQGWSYLFRPYDEIRYKGAYSNCNTMALYYLIVFCMILFKLHMLYVQKAKKWLKCIYFAGAGILLDLLFMTMCRTAWMVAAAVTLVYGVLIYRRCRRERWGRIFLRGCALLLCTIMLFPAVFWSVRWLPTVHPHPIWHEGEWNPDKVHSWDPADSPKYVEWDEFWNEVSERFSKLLSTVNDENPFLLKAHAEEKNIEIYLEDYSWIYDSIATRKLYYRLYLQNSTWIGNPKGKEIVFPELGNQIWHAQNLWIQMTYDFGYPAGILTILLSVVVFASACRRAGEINDNPYAAIPLLLAMVYFMFGLMEIVWSPGQLIFTLIFLVQHPQITGTEG